MEQVTLHPPARDELGYRARLLSDADTMSYNAPWSEDGTGRIFLTCEQAGEWYRRHVETGVYYAYIIVDGRPVGEVNINPDGSIGVVVEAMHRGKGYGKQALRLLCGKAFCELGLNEITDNFGTERVAAERLFSDVGFERVTPALVRLTREKYLTSVDGLRRQL